MFRVTNMGPSSEVSRSGLWKWRGVGVWVWVCVCARELGVQEAEW